MIRRNCGAIEEVLPDKKIGSVAPVLRIGIEREPVDQKEREGNKFFVEGRVFRINAKVSFGKIGIACSEMHRLIIGLRVGADEKEALSKKEKNKG